MNRTAKSLSVMKQNGISLQNMLLKALREYFDLRMQLKSGHFKKMHVFKKKRRSIAWIKNNLSAVENYTKDIEKK